MIHHLLRQAKAGGSRSAATMARRCSLLAFSIFLIISGCDDSHTSTWKECWVDTHGEVVHEECCETTCEYDDDCYYYGWDCDVDCTQTCYNNVSTPVATVVYETPGPPGRHPTPTATPDR